MEKSIFLSLIYKISKMKTPNFIVRIPEPCHEDWNKMEPDAKGKFCNSCSKSVFDFSTKTDAEIKDILLEYKDQKVCGHFKKSQVNRPLNICINLKDLPKNISMTKAFGIALFLVFGTFLFSCTDEHGQKVDKIEVVETEPQSQRYMLGMMSVDIPPPPIDSISEACTMMTGDVITTLGSLETTYIMNEEHVDGGISFEEIPVEEIVPVPLVKDTIIYEEPMIVGQMIIPYSEIDSTVVMLKDTSVNEATKKIETNRSIIKSKELVIYPNPSNGEFIITYELVKRTNVRLDIFDMKGILIRTVVNVSNQYEGKYQIPVNLNELPNGIYLVNLIKDEKAFEVERLVIER